MVEPSSFLDLVTVFRADPTRLAAWQYLSTWSTMATLLLASAALSVMPLFLLWDHEAAFGGVCIGMACACLAGFCAALAFILSSRDAVRYLSRELLIVWPPENWPSGLLAGALVVTGIAVAAAVLIGFGASVADGDTPGAVRVALVAPISVPGAAVLSMTVALLAAVLAQLVLYALLVAAVLAGFRLLSGGAR